MIAIIVFIVWTLLGFYGAYKLASEVFDILLEDPIERILWWIKPAKEDKMKELLCQMREQRLCEDLDMDYASTDVKEDLLQGKKIPNQQSCEGKL